MLKINLSSSVRKSGEPDEEVPVVAAEEPQVPEQAPTISSGAPGGRKPVDTQLMELQPQKRSRGLIVALLAVLVIGALAAAVYFRYDALMSLFSPQAEAPAPVAPMETPPAPAEMVTEPDPTFVVLNRIGDVVPDRLWLASATISHDGAYTIAGMSFDHGAMLSFAESLGMIGDVSASDLPDATASPEAVYMFRVSGRLRNVAESEILDRIPPDDLAMLGGRADARAEEFGVTFTALPEAGKTYDDRALPFVLEGSFDGLRNVIAELCPPDGSVRVYRISIFPADGTQTFDRVQAAFALRTKSSI